MPSLKHSLRRTYPVLRVSNGRFPGKIPYPQIEQQPDSLTLTDSVPSDLHRTRLLHMPMRLDVDVVVHSLWAFITDIMQYSGVVHC